MMLRFPALIRVAAAALALVLVAQAKDLRITLPKRSKPTPVQKLNRDGVKAIEKHDYDQAKKLFYRAYLIDPNDPFTLNNLGYVSELEGNIDRAQRFYDLASQQQSDAMVAMSNDPNIKGEPVDKVAGNAADKGMQVNRINVQAINLLRKGRAPEADLLLQKALETDPKNPFTLNNIGYAKEQEGELESALSYYTSAAQLRSDDPVIVTINKDWRGKPISDIAAENAKKLRREMGKQETPEARLARLNLEGVSALNRNDRRAARDYFHQAYKLDPNDAFTLNNMGYLAELEGDRETADLFYEKAAEARSSGDRVDVSTRRDMEGRRVREVANISNDKVEARMQQEREQREREGGPIVLKRRGAAATQPETQPAPTQPNQTQPPPQ